MSLKDFSISGIRAIFWYRKFGSVFQYRKTIRISEIHKSFSVRKLGYMHFPVSHFFFLIKYDFFRHRNLGHTQIKTREMMFLHMKCLTIWYFILIYLIFMTKKNALFLHLPYFGRRYFQIHFRGVGVGDELMLHCVVSTFGGFIKGADNDK